jgi:hypothetical protein
MCHGGDILSIISKHWARRSASPSLHAIYFSYPILSYTAFVGTPALSTPAAHGTPAA